MNDFNSVAFMSGPSLATTVVSDAGRLANGVLPVPPGDSWRAVPGDVAGFAAADACCDIVLTISPKGYF